MLVPSSLHRQNTSKSKVRLTMVPNSDPEQRAAVPSALWTLLQIRSQLLDPLNTMLVTTRLLDTQMYGNITSRQAHAIQRIEGSTQRIMMLLDELTTYVKVQAGEFESTPRDFCPFQLLDGIRKRCQPFAEAKELTFEMTTPDAFPTMFHGDSSSIQAIILALAWNAISFAVSGGVQITSEWAGGWVVTVKDSGPGILPDVVPSIFEPFKRGPIPGTTVPTSGTGMGLSIASALTQAIRGQLTLTETSSEGTTFRLHVPVHIKAAKG